MLHHVDKGKHLLDALIDLGIILLILDGASHHILSVSGLRVVTDGVDKGFAEHGPAVEELALVPLGACLVKVTHDLAVVPKEVVGDTLGQEGGVAEDREELIELDKV